MGESVRRTPGGPSARVGPGEAVCPAAAFASVGAVEEARREPGGMWWKGLLASALLLWQLGMIVYARFDPGRYFTWSPHDVAWNFDLEVRTSEGVLDHAQAVERYRLRRFRRQEHAIEHIKRAVRQYESTHGKEDGARVRMLYDKNGRSPREWNWPEDTVEK